MSEASETIQRFIARFYDEFHAMVGGHGLEFWRCLETALWEEKVIPLSVRVCLRGIARLHSFISFSHGEGKPGCGKDGLHHRLHQRS
jgi:hypothetical protein